MQPRKFAPIGFLIASVLFIVVAITTADEGQALNPTFLALSVVFAILTGIVWRRSGDNGAPPAS